VVRALQHGFDL
jgi:hypothetical protein